MFRVWGRAAAMILVSISALPLAAADGDLDLTFSADGKATILWDEDGISHAEATAVAPLGDGSVVVGGTLIWDPMTGGIFFDWVLAKLTRTGILDGNWGDGGRRRIAFDLAEGGHDELLGLYPEPDGSIYAVGWAGNGEGQNPAMARLLPDGDGDPEFGDAGYFYLLDKPWPNATLSFVTSSRQRDGKFLLAGHCLRCPSNTTHLNPFVLRLTPDGEPDAALSFDGWAAVSDGGTTNDLLTAVGSDASGKVVLAWKADGEPVVARLNWMGGLDGTFSGDGFADPDLGNGQHSIAALEVDPSTGEIYLVDAMEFFDVPVGKVTRMTAGGAPDSSFGAGGESFFALEDTLTFADAELQGDGKLVVVGKLNPPGSQRGGFFVARLDADGDRDDSFAGNGMARYEFDRTEDGEDGAYAVALGGGKPVVAGYGYDAADEADMAILRLRNSYLFVDGFEEGAPRAWSSVAP